MKILSFFISLLACILPCTGLAFDVAFKNQIIETALQQTTHSEEEEVSVQIAQLDENTQLQPCQSPLQMKLTRSRFSQQSNVVSIQCLDQNSWEFFVPVQIQIMTPVITANKLIKPGDFISEEDLQFEKMDKNQLLDGYFTNKEDLLGLTPFRMHPAGMVFTQKNVKKIPMMKKNQVVNLILQTGHIEILMTGITKSDGYKNEVIKVMNPSSKKIVDAIVIDRDKAKLIT